MKHSSHVSAPQQKTGALSSLHEKIHHKIGLQESLGWPREPKRPVLCLPMALSRETGGELLSAVLPGLLTLPVEFLVLGKGSHEFGALFTALQKKEEHRFHIVQDSAEERTNMYGASDIALLLHAPDQFQELSLLMQHGTVPIAPACDLLEDYDPVQERGTAFLFQREDVWHCFAAVVRALETFRFPFDWRTIQKQVLAHAKRV